MKWMTWITVLLPAVVSAQAVRDLALDEAIALGRQNSRVLRISEAKLNSATAKAAEANAGRLPSVRVEAGYKRLSDVPPFQVSLPIPQFKGPVTISPTVLDNYTMKATLQQPLFTGFRLSSTAHSAEGLAEASRFDDRNDEQDLTLAIRAAYWTLYQALQTGNYADENVVRLQTYQRDAENMVRVGLATRNDLLKIQVQLSNAKLMQIDAVNDVQVATMTLNNLIGLPLEQQIRPTSSPGVGNAPDSNAVPQLSPDSLLSLAIARRPDLRAMQWRVEAAKSSLTAARGGWWPQLYLTGSYYYNRPNARFQPTLDQFKTSWEVGLQLQFDVWNWGSTAYQSQQAEAALMQNSEQRDQLKDNIAVDVERYSLALRRARDKVDVARLAIDQADENLRTTDDKFNSGVATSSDLLDANVALLQAKTNLTGALIEYEMARARLGRAVGETGEESKE